MTTTSSLMSTVPADDATSRSITVSSWLMTVSSGVLLARYAMAPALFHRCAHRTERHERLAFFDQIGRELRGVAAAHILRRVDRSGGNEQCLANLERHRR